MFKKLLVSIICSYFMLSPVIASSAGYTDYDFSDEAQRKFEQNNVIPAHQNNNFIRKKQQESFNNFKERSNYAPANGQFFIPANQNPLQGSVIAVPAGTAFTVTFNSGISSGSLDKNDRLTASLKNDWYYNGILLAPAGSLVYGTAMNAKSAGFAYGSGEMEISFNQILPPNGNMINFKSQTIKLAAKKERTKKMSRDILIGSAATMLTGAALTAISGSDNWGQNMLVYGTIGAIGGGIRGLMQKGNDVDILNGTDVQIILTEPLNISPYN